MTNNERLIGNICSSYDWIESYAIGGALQTVLSHNDEPTSLQATSITSAKEVIDRAHDLIAQDIDNLENALELLRVRRHALNRLSVQHAGALSTFRRLPDEILSEIFLHTRDNLGFRVGRLDEGPWRLRAVCRKWASVVEGCSQLWCNMVIDVADDQLRPAAFARALRFCGSRPLHMKLSMNSDWDDDYDRPVEWNKYREVIDALTSSSPRWEALIIESDGELILAVLELFPRLEQRLPLLRSLTLEGMEFPAISASSSPQHALLTAPLLETVHVEFPHQGNIAELFDLLPLPRHQIRRLSCLHGSEPDADLLYGRFSLSKEKWSLLEHCTFLSDHSGIRFHIPIPASIRVENDSVLYLVTSLVLVLDTFSVPSLRTLSLGVPDSKQPDSEDDESGIFFKHASDMLFVSRCSLVSLTLFHTFPLVEEFLQILEIIPTLRILDMRVSWKNGAARDEVLCSFFTALGKRTTHNSAFSLLPALRDLRLSVDARSRIANGPWKDYPPTRSRNFRFVSQVFGAITERSKGPSDFRVFSFGMSIDSSSVWYLPDDDILRLQDLELTKFFLNEPRSGLMEPKDEAW